MAISKFENRAWFSLVALMVVAGLLGLYAVVEHDKKCRDAGGVPVRGACINPAAVIEVD
jgi:hypothetical protein